MSPGLQTLELPFPPQIRKVTRSEQQRLARTLGCLETATHELRGVRIARGVAAFVDRDSPDVLVTFSSPDANFNVGVVQVRESAGLLGFPRRS